jgi:cell division protein FtsW
VTEGMAIRGEDNSIETATVPAGGDSSAPGAFDYQLVLITLLLVAWGLVNITSATTGDDGAHILTQLVGLGLGALCAVGLLLAPYAWIRRSAVPVYCLSLLLMGLVFVPAVGKVVNGAPRWIEAFGVQFQPSELSRLALIWMLADYLAKNRGRLADTLGVGIPGLGLVLLPVLLTIFQRDFGTIVILLGLGGVMFYVSGLRWQQLAPSALLAGLGALVLALTPGYRFERLKVFLDPYNPKYRYNEAYQQIEGWIALATGGWLGVGYANGLAPVKVPEAHTDYIAAVTAEEWGAFGWLAIVALQWLLLWRCTHISLRARDLFGMLTGLGITALFGAQAFVNLSVVCGLLPAKGLVLPFLSYGPSAAVVHVASIGLMLKIALAREGDPQLPEATGPRGWMDWRPIEVRRRPDALVRPSPAARVSAQAPIQRGAS